MTYSIIARDAASGELGIAVQSRYFAAGRIVPCIEAGVGVVASQSFTNPLHGQEGLRMLRAGEEPQQALKKLLAEDSGAAVRQVAMLDARGRTAVHTGTKCVAAAGHAASRDCCAQANMMARATVWRAMVQAFEQATGALAERLLNALQAAESEGGDLRGRQAASLIVVSGKASSGHAIDRTVDLRVDDHHDPVGELGRLLAYSRAHDSAARATDMILKGEGAQALEMLDACCSRYPEEPEFLVRLALAFLVAGRSDDARRVLARAQAVNPGWSELVLRLADAGVVPVPRSMLEPLIVPTGGR